MTADTPGSGQTRAGVSLIFTNNSAWSGPDPRARIEEAAEAVIDTGRTHPEESACIIAAALT